MLFYFVKPEYSEELLLQIFSYVVSRYEQSDKIKSLNKNILKCKKGELPLTDLIKELYEKLEKEEPILYILKSTLKMFVWKNGELNPEQESAIFNENSVLLIACPGSGKTRTLTYKNCL